MVTYDLDVIYNMLTNITNYLTNTQHIEVVSLSRTTSTATTWPATSMATLRSILQAHKLTAEASCTR